MHNKYKIKRDSLEIKRYHYYLVFTISFLVQLIFILNYKGNPLGGDANSYYEISQNILKNGTSLLQGEINVRRPPAYPFFLASVFFVFGNKIIFAQLIQAFLIAVTCIFILQIGKIVFNERIAIISAVFIAIHPVLVAQSFYLLTEALTIFLVTLLSYMLTCAFIKNKKTLFILSSFLIGLATLTRPVLILFPFFLVFVMRIFNEKFKIIKYAAFLIIPAILVVSAWATRNFWQTKLFIPIALGGELEIWNGAYFPGGGHSDHPKTVEQRDLLSQKFNRKNQLSEDYLKNGKGRQYYLFYLTMQDFKKEGMAYIAQHPFKYIALFPKKIVNLYIGSYCFIFGISDSFNSLFFPKNKVLIKTFFLKVFIKTSVLLLSIITFIFFFFGLLSNINNRYYLPTFSILSYWTLFFLFFSAITRYSIPLIPLMMLTGVSGINRIFFIKRA